MKTNYPLLFLLAAFCCLNMQCKKEREIDKLPSATTTGNGAFGCLINGRAWPVDEPGDHGYFLFYNSGKLDLTYTVYSPNGLTLDEGITISTKAINKPGVHWIPFKDDNVFTILYREELFLSTSPVNKNGFAYMNIARLDSVNRIVSGTFSFSLYNYWGTKKISVDEGRFDLRY